MTDPAIDDHARHREPHDDDREARDDTGRPIDHRSAPGAFERAPRGPTIPSMEVRPDEGEIPVQTDAVHHVPPERDPALAYPPPEHEPLKTTDDPSRAKKSVRRAAVERTEDLTERAKQSGLVRSVVRTIIDINRKTADRLETWLTRS
jgi:hypothetical protein